MKALNPLTLDQVDKSTKEVFDSIQGKLGMLPNLHAAMANSPVLLNALLAYENMLGRGYYSAKEIEAIALAVSQINDCDYSLAAHSAMAKELGFSEREIIDIRKGTSSDEKLRVLTAMARELTKRKGKTSGQVMNAFFSAGFSKQAFAELLGWVVIVITMNYLSRNVESEIDFPPAPNLRSVEAPISYYSLR